MAVKIEIENDCVGCPQGCISCGRKYAHYTYLFCDECDDEVEELYDVDGTQLCEDCLKKSFDLITEDNAEDYMKG